MIEMNAFVDALKSLLMRLLERPIDAFTCGSCPRMVQCGLPPTEQCLMKLQHEERMCIGKYAR
ncbi:hypothetical protein [Azospirillum sp.]|uniref:hypothetical protein n=1 Tax=Azospirillum sp. TaxID=34012 RepID=UPI003D70A1ED